MNKLRTSGWFWCRLFIIAAVLRLSFVSYDILPGTLFEAAFILLLGMWCQRWYQRVLWYLILMLHIMQLINLVQTGKYIEPLTLLNLHSALDIGVKNICFLLLYVVWFVWLYGFGKVVCAKYASRFWLLLSLFLLLEMSCKDLLPINAAVRSMKKAYEQAFFIPTYDDGEAFRRNRAFEAVGNRWKDKSTYGNNVVLIFTEGLSSLVLSENLTPNAFRLLRSGLSVDNYYNHTAATYRGIKGQLMSGFLYLGGKKNAVTQMYQQHEVHSAETLESILRNRGYITAFVSPHEKSHYFNDFIRDIGFQKVVSDNEEDLSDRKLYDVLFRELEVLSAQEKPFFLSTYVLGSHFGLDSPDLKYEDGTNSYLNKFYNQDYWLGEFLKKFEKLPSARDTIIVFTADHATYPSSDYRKTFNAQSEVFADRIPLVFYKPGMKPSKVDAEGATSLALAPTILNMLGIADAENHFLGHSLFDDVQRREYEYMYVEGTNCYVVDGGEIKEKKFKKDCTVVKKYYDFAG